MSDVFDGYSAPDVPEEVFRDIEGEFCTYLFFENVSRGVRKYTCTACHGSFERGAAVLLRTESADDRALASAKHLSAEEIRRAEISRIKRLAEFAKLRADGVTVRYGDFAGQLLADILEGDLMENENIKGEKICRT